MERSADLGHLKTNEWDQLQDLADRFEEAWRAGGPVDLNRFLPPPGSPLRVAVLQELVKLDLEFRGRAGQPVDLASYLEKFRELGTARTLSPQIIYEEYRVRQVYGDRPQLGPYENRFPDQFEQFKKLVEEQPIEVVTRDHIAPNTVAHSAVSPAQPQPPKPTPPIEEPAKEAAPKPESSKKAKAGRKNKDMLQVVGGYKLIKRIGSGGFGEVWRAEAPGGVEAAVKLIFRPVDHQEAQRELQSLELIKKLRHPFLLTTQAFWAFEDRLYIVMELADGSLRDRLKECHKAGLAGIPVDELLTYFREAAEALDFLHAQHVLHRDIKPENILLLQHHAKLADFGLARSQESQRMVSATGSGTPLYMAPEVWRGKVSPRSDQYSLAMTYGELRLDRRIYSGSDMMQIMFDHLERQPDLNPLPEAEQKVLLGGMDKDPDKRYPSCVEFVQALERAALGEKARLRKRDHSDDTAELEPSAAGLVPPHTRKGSSAGTSTLAGASAAPGHDQSGERTSPIGTGLPGTLSGDWHPVAGWRGSATAPMQDLKKRRSWLPWTAAVLILALGGGLAVVGLPHIRPTPDDPGKGQKGNGQEQSPKEVVELPAGCKPAEGAKIETVGNKKYYDRIVKEQAGQAFVFLLIPHTSDNDPSTFYIMENKVSYGQFLAATEDVTFKERLNEFREKADWTLQGAWEDVKYPKKDQLPITNVTVTEAYCFARWLGGNLPTLDQWRKAAGYNEPERGKGPFQGESWDRFLPSEFVLMRGCLTPNASHGIPLLYRQLVDYAKKQLIAVNRRVEGPLPVGQAVLDRSFFGCRDMAGNGVEWTRTMQETDKGSVPLKEPNKRDSVTLAGRSYTAPNPLDYLALPESWEYGATEPDISFRVVLEP